MGRRKLVSSKSRIFEIYSSACTSVGWEADESITALPKCLVPSESKSEFDFEFNKKKLEENLITFCGIFMVVGQLAVTTLIYALYSSLEWPWSNETSTNL